jgi:hypothetical protein
MLSTSYCRRTASLVLAGVLVTSAPALAEDATDAPQAPPNVPTSGPPPVAEGTGRPVQEAPPSSSITEPTFRAETQSMRWPNVPLLATGSVLFAGSYLPAVVVAAVRDTDDDNDLYKPLVGPWMMFANGPDESKGYKTLLVVNGITQGLGALMLLGSFMIPERVTEHWYLLGSNDVRLTPSRVGTGYGMGAAGRF